LITDEMNTAGRRFPMKSIWVLCLMICIGVSSAS
jgi:hypothetical protein